MNAPAASAADQRRRRREGDLIAATRRLFDSRGVLDVQVDDIVAEVGINRAILYRHFTGKEELFALTLVGYLDELGSALAAATLGLDDPVRRLTAVVETFVTYGAEHPAFVDCAQSLMVRPGDELLAQLSKDALLTLGRAITGCLSVLVDALEYGVAQGDFAVGDPVLLANLLYATGLGALQLGRVGILVGEESAGLPTMGVISREQVREHLVAAALAAAVSEPGRT